MSCICGKPETGKRPNCKFYLCSSLKSRIQRNWILLQQAIWHNKIQRHSRFLLHTLMTKFRFFLLSSRFLLKTTKQKSLQSIERHKRNTGLVTGNLPRFPAPSICLYNLEEQGSDRPPASALVCAPRDGEKNGAGLSAHKWLFDIPTRY